MFNTSMAIVHPEIASHLCRCREVNRDHEGLFSRNAARTLWHAAGRHQTSDRELWLSGRSDDQTSSVRESKVLGHLLAVGRASVSVAGHRSVSERQANQISLRHGQARPLHMLTILVFSWIEPIEVDAGKIQGSSACGAVSLV